MYESGKKPYIEYEIWHLRFGFPLFLNCVRILNLKIKNTKKDRQNKKVLERNKNILYSLVVLFKKEATCVKRRKRIYIKIEDI